jgi:anti-sigma factor ChrR (cupin superfamily)
MTCAKARQSLGASRRNDWSTQDLAALSAHLATCADCRKVEASFRGVGEQIRDLPSIQPPASFRASVFAAIAADQAHIQRQAQAEKAGKAGLGAPAQTTAPRVAAAITEAASADTDPALRVVRRTPPPSTPWRIGDLVERVRASSYGVRAAMAIAAMLLLALIGSVAIPASPLYLGGAGAQVAQYQPNAQYAHVSSAGASHGWLVYSGKDASGAEMLFADNRSSKTMTPLLNAPSKNPLTVYGVTSRWAIWSARDGDAWTLYASPLAGGTPQTLLTSADDGSDSGPATLHSVWVGDEMALVAVTTRAATSEIRKIELASTTPKATTLASTNTLNHTYVSPSEDSGAYYWAEVWMDGGRDLHSVVWREDASQHIERVTSSEGAFQPQATGGSVLYVDVPGAQATSADVSEATAALSGSVHTQPKSGKATQVGANANPATLQAAGGMALWRSGGKVQTYDVRAGGASRVDGQVRDASGVYLSGSALVWTDGDTAPLKVYNLG